ncbi:MAG: hypothetical protein ABR597_13990 [Bacteroidales bacterium]
MDRIEEALQRLFLKHRVVFWYDGKKRDGRTVSVSHPARGANIGSKNNEFEAKHLILVEKPDQ